MTGFSRPTHDIIIWDPSHPRIHRDLKPNGSVQRKEEPKGQNDPTKKGEKKNISNIKCKTQASKQAAMFKTRVLAPHWSPMKYGSKSVIKYWIPPPLSGGRDTMPRAPDPQPWGLMAREEAEGCKSIINENGVL
ncbi:hypothetical protein GX48_01435 [Paracoccidioides brasiliensis]|nr:hypothetical protein GX48_01435 [Paracoccidioides brasiliensis]